MFTVQEEIGLYGAMTSAFEIKPDWAITVDVTEANKDISKSETLAGKGPFITIKNADFIGNRCINNWIKDIAKRRKIQPLKRRGSKFRNRRRCQEFAYSKRKSKH